MLTQQPGDSGSSADAAACESWLWCGTMTSAASSGVMSGYRTLSTAIATTPPTSWAMTKAGTDAGAIPAKVSEKIRPTLIAGLAKLVELVKK